MGNYKLQSSWTVTLVLTLNEIPNYDFSAVCSTKNGDIVGKNGGQGVVKYDGKYGQLLENCLYDGYPCISLVMYTESLLSLPAGGRE